MKSNEVQWSQRANAKKNTISHFSIFLYEFIGARFTFIAFIGLFNFAAIGFSFFDKILSSGIAIILYYIISDAFTVFWTGINLEYQITKKGIRYNWGVFRDHELLVPFDKITKITAVRSKDKKRNAFVFENSLDIQNREYGFSKELYFNVLSFENIQNLEEAVVALKEIGHDIHIQEVHKSDAVNEKLSNSYLYLKFLQLLSLVFLYISTFIGLNILDRVFLPSNSVSDVIIEQEKSSYYTNYFYNHLGTTKGHTFTLEGKYFNDHINQNVNLFISPIFKTVVGVENCYLDSYETIKNDYHGGVNFLFKLMAFIVSIFSAVYIFYKRNYIVFQDLSIFLLFPIFILSIAFFLFN